MSVTLDQSATVRVLVTHKVSGRKVKGRCVVKARRGPRCSLTVQVAKQTFTAGKGRITRTLRFPKLAPGRYTVTITAANSAGKTSKPITFTITVKR